ncbi:MAG: DUF2225 domain-containing protein [Planctomycetota bacterium]|nr:DUF2225 domain-containing protein [Planctomycetota bacterium]
METTCPLCKNRLRVREVGGGFAKSQDSDLLIRMQGRHVIQAEIHTCLRCRFSGTTEDFTSRTVPAERIKRYFSDVLPRLSDHPETDSAVLGLRRPGAGGDSRPSNTRRRKLRHISRTPLPHVQYYWAALVGPTLGLAPTEIGLHFVRAYWCLRLAPAADLAETLLKPLRKVFLRGAIRHLRQGLRNEKNRALVYLIAELCRRNDYFGLANHYFERFLYKEKHVPSYLKRAARRLFVASRNGDSQEKSMEDVLYAPEDPVDPESLQAGRPGRPAEYEDGSWDWPPDDGDGE